MVLAQETVSNESVARSGRARAYRLTSIDVLRGLVVVVMALDHVRDHFHSGASQDPMNDPAIGVALYLTRWVTHFCAPVFVCLAGVSAGLMTGRRNPSNLGRFLLQRGLWILAVEWFVIATALSLAPFGSPQLGGRVLVLLQTLWAIGGSMVVLAGAQFLGRPVCLALGLAIVAGHNLLDPVWPMVENPLEPGPPLWVALHTSMSFVLGPYFAFVAYPLLPWVGVMLLGFGGSSLFELEPGVRTKRLTAGGVAAIVVFVLVRASHVYGDPNPWMVQATGLVSTLLDFMNVSKYPPSLLFVLATLGPAAVFCARADGLPRGVRDVLITYGRAPFAFYIAHFYLIHALAVALGVLQGFQASQMMTLMLFFPKGYGLPLPGVYLVWFAVVAVLYPLCRWVSEVKARRADWWLSYL
jgi:uncharacterized membrane protein